MVSWYGTGTWDVVYVPNPGTSGLDVFSYSATDCPGQIGRWAANTGTVALNVVPTGVAGSVTVTPTQGAVAVDLSQYALNSANFTAATTKAMSSAATAGAAAPLTFTVASLPPRGSLTTPSGRAITTAPFTLPSSGVLYVPPPCCSATSCSAADIARQLQSNTTSFAFQSSDAAQTAPATVLLHIACPAVNIPPTVAADYTLVFGLLGGVVGFLLCLYLARARILSQRLKRHEEQHKQEVSVLRTRKTDDTRK